jgi:hypothetical protein
MDSVAPTPRRWGPRVEYMAVKQMLLEGLTPGQMHDQNRMISRQFFIRLWDHWTLYEMLPHETRQWDAGSELVAMLFVRSFWRCSWMRLLKGLRCGQ